VIPRALRAANADVEQARAVDATRATLSHLLAEVESDAMALALARSIADLDTVALLRRRLDARRASIMALVAAS